MSGCYQPNLKMITLLKKFEKIFTIADLLEWHHTLLDHQ